ncbi:MAG: thioredoxin family protein [Acidobacteriota bacterium]
MPRHLSVIVVAALALVSLAAPPTARAQTTVTPANEVVSAAVKRAGAEQKVVLVEFGASWCTWCRSFEAFVQAPDTGPIIAANYIVVNLTVHERDGKESLENPGGNALMEAWGGGNSGLPFYVFVDKDGKKIADSDAMPNGGNIGFPAVPVEVAAFMGLIARTAPRLSRADGAVLESYLTRAMAKPRTAP